MNRRTGIMQYQVSPVYIFKYLIPLLFQQTLKSSVSVFFSVIEKNEGEGKKPEYLEKNPTPWLAEQVSRSEPSDSH